MSKSTSQQYKQAVKRCKEVFLKKTQDYGTSWRILRLSALTDKIFIKAKRIRNIQEKEKKEIEEGIEPEFIGIVNYSIMALIQCSLPDPVKDRQETQRPADLKEATELSEKQLNQWYDEITKETQQLMEAKNHDYGEAWRDMRISSLVDLILMRIFRIKKIEENQGKTLVSEGIDSNYYDIINYAIFALIKLEASNEGATDH